MHNTDILRTEAWLGIYVYIGAARNARRGSHVLRRKVVRVSQLLGSQSMGQLDKRCMKSCTCCTEHVPVTCRS